MIKPHGWLLPKFVELDREYQGRYDAWSHVYDTGDRSATLEPLSWVNLGDAGHSETLAMLTNCIDRLEKSYGSVGVYKGVEYLVFWLLYSLGHPAYKEPPRGLGKDSFSRVSKHLDLELLIVNPSDYWGHLLAVGCKYAQNAFGRKSKQKFYPTFQPVCTLLATAATEATRQRHHQEPPYQAIDLTMGTGRLPLALSDVCWSLVGWEWDNFLMACAVANFMLYAPFMALPLPQFGGDLVIGDSLEGKGRSIITGKPVTIDRPLVVIPEEEPEEVVPETIEVNGVIATAVKSGDYQMSIF